MKRYRFKEILGQDHTSIGIVDGYIKDNQGPIDDEFSDYFAIPGFIDGHIHGGVGHDVMDASDEAIDQISEYLASKGVTAFLATTVTDTDEKTRQAILNNKSAVLRQLPGAGCIGTFLEGPFLSPERKGAHPEELLQEPNLAKMDEWLALGQGSIRVVAVAPELPKSDELIKFLVDKDVKVALAHSDATSEVTDRAYAQGASIAVHLCNGMRPIHHREAGIVASTLLNDEVYAELIVDGVHVCDHMVKLILKNKGDKVYLISDCMRAGGLSDGNYQLGALSVKVSDGIARISTGSLAGSTLNLHQALKNIMKITNYRLEEALPYVTIQVAKALGIDHEMGSLEQGKFANITVIDDQFEIVATIVKGKVVYRRK